MSADEKPDYRNYVTVSTLLDSDKVPTILFEEWSLKLPPAQLGRALKEYVAETQHQSGIDWEGFTYRDMVGIRRFFRDFIRYYVEATKNEPNYFKERNNINPL